MHGEILEKHVWHRLLERIFTQIGSKPRSQGWSSKQQVFHAHASSPLEGSLTSLPVTLTFPGQEEKEVCTERKMQAWDVLRSEEWVLLMEIESQWSVLFLLPGIFHLVLKDGLPLPSESPSSLAQCRVSGSLFIMVTSAFWVYQCTCSSVQWSCLSSAFQLIDSRDNAHLSMQHYALILGINPGSAPWWSGVSVCPIHQAPFNTTESSWASRCLQGRLEDNFLASPLGIRRAHEAGNYPGVHTVFKLCWVTTCDKCGLHTDSTLCWRDPRVGASVVI